MTFGEAIQVYGFNEAARLLVLAIKRKQAKEAKEQPPSTLTEEAGA